ncbi:nuclease-related domain-containing protein [Ornithinibacillus salinisoli]|uniref:Nuclease-related domain-containing protein n=1 Tax=Ornithinibacillus salinisoli TaxID=1848459 RepID=A0ABW4VW59_9BACI
MAIFIGKSDLINSLNVCERLEDQKEIEAEIEVGNQLQRMLPDDTYVVAQPKIGEVQPDFLVISPTYGFRIIEVKNIRITDMENVFSNGILQTKYGNKNPFAQVKSYAVSWKNYLLSNHRDLGLDDPFRYTGYAVIHKGFSKLEFEHKFGGQISAWAPGDADNYYKYHFCFDEIGNDFNDILAGATRFKSYALKNFHIHEIIDHLIVASYKKDEDSNIGNSDEQLQKVNRVVDEVLQPKEALQADTDSHQPRKKRKKLLVIVPILIVFLTIIVFSFANLLEKDKVIDVGSMEGLSRIISGEDHTEEYVEVSATVNSFYYDAESETKIMTLSDGSDQMEAVIAKNVDVPKIEEGQIYTFRGYIQLSEDESRMELKITGVEQDE